MNTKFTLKHLFSASVLALALPLASTAIAHEGEHDGVNHHGLNKARQGTHCEKGGHRSHQGHYRHHNKDGAPHYLRGLELSQTQKDQLFQIRHEQAPVLREQQKQRRELMQALHDTTQAPAFDDAKAQQIAAGLANLERDQILQRARTQAKVLALLTPEQRAKAEEFKKNHAHGERTGFKGRNTHHNHQHQKM